MRNNFWLREDDFFICLPFLLIWFVLKWVWWNIRGRRYIKYSWFQCDKCGKEWHKSFEVSELLSRGEKLDTLRVCPLGKGCRFIEGIRLNYFEEGDFDKI